MEVILREDIEKLGSRGEVVKVAPGYARNFLVPQGLAVEPTPGNLKKVEARKKEIEKIERERREQQAVLVKRLEGVEVTLERRANEQGHLYGAVSATEIAKALQAVGYNINADDINLPGKLDRIEKYTVTVAFADDLKADIAVWVAPDPESKAAIDAARKAAAAEPPPPSNFEGAPKR